MGWTKHTDIPQEWQGPDDRQQQDDPEFQLGADLHSLRVAANLLVDSGRIPEAMNAVLHQLLRGLDGCARCHRMLGEMHSGSCPTGGRYVLWLDLAILPEKPADAEPF